MRIVKEFSLQGIKTTVFAWNNRYLIKLEMGGLEQTFKVNETDVGREDDILTLLDAEFAQQALARFDEMGRSLHEAMHRANI